MEKQEASVDIKGLVEQVFCRTLGSGDFDKHRCEVDGWDSLSHLMLLMGVEEAYKVRFSTEEAAAISTLSELEAAVHRQRAQP